MASVEELEARVQELEAYEGVRRTIADYLLFHDLPGVVDQLVDLFTEDATLEISGYGEAIEGTLVGREAIRGLYGGIEEHMVKGPPTYKHITTNLRIVLEGENEAVATQYLLEMGGPQTEKGPGGGLYQERLRREEDGRWRFTKKRIIATSQQSVHEGLISDI